MQILFPSTLYHNQNLQPKKFPWFGKLSLRSRVTASKANRQEAIFKAKQLEITRKIATTYYELGFIVSSQEINERLIDMIGQILRASEIGYENGNSLIKVLLH